MTSFHLEQHLPVAMEMKSLNNLRYHEHHQQRNETDNKLFMNHKQKIRFIVVYLQRLASISISLSSIIFGASIGDMMFGSVELSAIRTLIDNTNKQLANKVSHLLDFNMDFLDQWHIIFIVLAILSMLLGISALFCLDSKRINMYRVILYVVFNFLFVLGDIALVTASLLSMNKINSYNFLSINSIKRLDEKEMLILNVAAEIFNSSQTHIMSIVCLFIALSILKFVTIPFTLLSMWPIQTNNNNNNQNITNQKNERPRVSEMQYPRPPPRSVNLKTVNSPQLPIHREHSVTSSMLEGHNQTKRRHTISEYSMHSQRYPSLPSETNRRLSDSEMLYINDNQKQDSEGLFATTLDSNQHPKDIENEHDLEDELKQDIPFQKY